MPELKWMGDGEARRAARRVAYRLIEPLETVGAGPDGDLPENLLIQGDNLEALKSLLPLYAGRVKCIFIDPPYNTKSAFEHYDDNLEHSQWLSMIYPRLVLLGELLSEEGSIWVTIDDNEGHYLKVLMDQVFGRQNFVANVVWQKRYSRENRVAIGGSHDHILIYAKDASNPRFVFHKLPLEDKQRKVYKNPNSDPRGPWRGVSLAAQGYRPNQMYTITAPNGRQHKPPAGSCWKVVESKYQDLLKNNLIYFGKDGNAVPSRKQYLIDIEGMVPWTWWPHEEAGHNDEAKRESQALHGADCSFGTPKPERLIERALHIATNPGDLVLDSFLGSGTTAAVAHKMGRRWIGIEMGEHARTHCLPRLRKVVEGEQGGVSKAVGWTGGGGFRFARLGETLFDEHGRINPAVRFPALAAWLWFVETRSPHSSGRFESPLLGIDGERAIVLLYNGILGDRRPQGGNVLTHAIWDTVHALAPDHQGEWLVYGEACRLTPATLKRHAISFRQIPYDIGLR